MRASRLKRILAEPGIHELLALHRADALASRRAIPSMSTYCEYYLKAEPAGPINPPPLITGHDLLRHGLKAGAEFATILDAVRDAQLEGQTHTKEQALEWLDRWLDCQQ